MPNDKLDKAFATFTSFIEKSATKSTRSSSGSTSSARKSNEADYVEGASFIHKYKDGRVSHLVIENGVWLMDGRVVPNGKEGVPTSSGAATLSSGNSENGFRFWSVSSNA